MFLCFLEDGGGPAAVSIAVALALAVAQHLVDLLLVVE